MANSKRLNIGDIRVVIGCVLGIIGIFLLLCAFLNDTAEQLAKSGGVNANLWAGAALLIVALGMWIWALLRPETSQKQTSDSPTSDTQITR